MRGLMFILLGAFGLLLTVEGLLRFLPVSSATQTDYYVDPLILGYPPGHRWTTATGWDLRNAQAMKANNFGFSGDVDFVRDPQAVALIGDSYVEASMLENADRPGPQLTRALTGRRPIYAMGAPGSALLDYAERIRWAHDRFGLRDFVLLMEVGDVRQSICGSGNVHGPCLDALNFGPSVQKALPASNLKRWLRHSAFLQYLTGQLQLKLTNIAQLALFANAVAATPVESSKAEPNKPAIDDDAQREAMVRAVADAFFARIDHCVEGHLVIAILGRMTREALEDGSAADTSLMRERSLFIDIARAHGVTIVDAEPPFREHWRQSNLSLAVSPKDGHLNPIGVSLLMQAVAEQLP